MQSVKIPKDIFPGFIDTPNQWSEKDDILGYFARVKPLLEDYPCLKRDVRRLSEDSGIPVPYEID